MEQLIIFRAIQGLGAGAVLPIVLTIIGDIFAQKERAKVQGLFSGVWGLSSILGPALGGLIVDHFSWRWVFYINIPFGLLSAFLFVLCHVLPLPNYALHLTFNISFGNSFALIVQLFATT